jgi:hypothetical protein
VFDFFVFARCMVALVGALRQHKPAASALIQRLTAAAMSIDPIVALEVAAIWLHACGHDQFVIAALGTAVVLSRRAEEAATPPEPTRRRCRRKR